MLRAVFEAYVRAPDLLGDGAARRIESGGIAPDGVRLHRGMTDRYLLEEHARVAKL